MLKKFQDVESYDHILNRLFNEVEESESKLFDIYGFGQKIGLDNQEIDSIYFHLKRSDMIEQAEGSLLRFSVYGNMLQRGEIKHGYVPI